MTRIDPKNTKISEIRSIDDNKLYLSEILPLILVPKINQYTFCKLKGLNLILETLHKYKEKNPECEEEKETLLNLIDCICLLLVERSFQEEFRNSCNGIELMLKLIV